MGNCQKCRWLLNGKPVTLDPEMFTEEYPTLSHEHLSVAKLKHFLMSKLKPEFMHLHPSLSPPVTQSLINGVSKGHSVSFKAVVKNKLKLRVKVILNEGKLAILHFVEKTCTAGELALQLSKRLKVPDSSLNIIYGRVKLSRADNLENYTATHSLKLSVVVAESEIDLASSLFDQPWKLYGVGLNYEAECSNPYCYAYQQIVIIHKGYGSFQLKEDELMGDHCPCCRTPVKLVAYGVLSCHYTFKARQDWDNTSSGMQYERLQTFKQILGTPSITTFKLQMPFN
mmetsp:Transcript_1878/g.4047  ORF Transcript_1878/g.4047 Transcript_1878/m.4047 type:complete len:284 (+) Transcript_1878:9738-10589(+)